jgi:hypothetical protein
MSRGPARPGRGWVTRAVIAVSELAAGRSHRRNYDDFMAHGGLPPLLAAQGLPVDQRRVVSGGAIGLYLAALQSPGQAHAGALTPAHAQELARLRSSAIAAHPKKPGRIHEGCKLEFTIPS